MIGEQTAEGWQVRLRPRGAGRFLVAGCLCFWLCGWAVGETFVLTFLFTGARSLLAGQPVPPGAAPPALGPALAVGAFLILWLALWTAGGVAALAGLLGCLWSEDRVTVGPEGLAVRRSLGPFRRTRKIPRDQLRGLRTSSRAAALVAETTTATVELSRLGTRAEREELAAELRGKLGLGEPPDAAPDGLPEGWQETITPEGERVLVTDPALRRRQARVATGVALALGAGALGLVLKAVDDLAVAPLAAMACAAAFGAAGVALWLGRGRMEWILGSGRLRLRRRLGPRAKDLFTAHALEVTISADGDGDASYALEAVATAEPERTLPGRRAAPRSRRPILAASSDPVPPRRLGAWLAQRAGLPLRDRTTAAARAAEADALRTELEKVAKLGPLALRFVVKVSTKRPAA